MSDNDALGKEYDALGELIGSTENEHSKARAREDAIDRALGDSSKHAWYLAPWSAALKVNTVIMFGTMFKLVGLGMEMSEDMASTMLRTLMEPLGWEDIELQRIAIRTIFDSMLGCYEVDKDEEALGRAKIAIGLTAITVTTSRVSRELIRAGLIPDLAESHANAFRLDAAQNLREAMLAGRVDRDYLLAIVDRGEEVIAREKTIKS